MAKLVLTDDGILKYGKDTSRLKLTAWLNYAGFYRIHKFDKECLMYRKQFGKRIVTVQLWKSGISGHRTSHSIGGYETTYPTFFSDLEGMKEAIFKELTRTDHPGPMPLKKDLDYDNLPHPEVVYGLDKKPKNKKQTKKHKVLELSTLFAPLANAPYEPVISEPPKYEPQASFKPQKGWSGGSVTIGDITKLHAEIKDKIKDNIQKEFATGGKVNKVKMGEPVPMVLGFGGGETVLPYSKINKLGFNTRIKHVKLNKLEHDPKAVITLEVDTNPLHKELNDLIKILEETPPGSEWVPTEPIVVGIDLAKDNDTDKMIYTLTGTMKSAAPSVQQLPKEYGKTMVEGLLKQAMLGVLKKGDK